MPERFKRLEALIQKDGLNILSSKKVAIFGVGGVGGYVLEALVRSGIKDISIIDHDKVDITNFNRQIIALEESLNRLKVDVAEERAKSINPDVIIHKYPIFYLEENKDLIDLSSFDYVIDAIDTILAKVFLIKECQRLNVPLISSLGTGNRLDPSKLRYGDLFETKDDPFAKIMRKEAKKAGINELPVVYSLEKPIKVKIEKDEHGRHSPGSSSFVPPAAGLFIASKVVRDLLGIKND